MTPRYEGQCGSISHYDLLEKVGQGGMGVVYRAHDRKLDRIVALKFLQGEALHSPARRERFIHEALAISSLNHRHIAVIHTIEECQGQVFLVFEYLPGGTLRSRLDDLHSRGEMMPAAQVAAYGAEIADALSHAHAHGIIHRDIKPGNIMFARDGDLKIVDFGVSRLSGRTPITQAGVMLGTPLYMSPEQAQGQAVDERSDIFSLGVVLFEMAAGHPPFVSDQPAGIAHQIIHQPAPRIRAGNAAFPPELDRIIGRALEKNPAARYPRMLDLADQLRSFLNVPAARADLIATETLPALKRPRIWKRSLWILAALMVVALLFLLLGPWRTSGYRNREANQFYERGAGYLYRFYVPGNVDKAIVAFGGALQKDPAFGEAYAALSKAYLQKYLNTRDRQFLDDARTNANKALGLDSNSVSARVASGAVLDQSGDRENAVVAFRRALASDPANVEAMRDLAVISDYAGNTQEAEALYKKALKLRPNDWATWSEAGVFHYRHQQYTQAEQDFRTTISLAHDSPAAHRNLGAAAMALGKYPEAEQALLTSIKLGPIASAYSNLGSLYIYQGRYREAVSVLETAVQSFSTGYQKLYIVLANLAEAYFYTPEYTAKAPETYRRAIQEVEKLLAFAPNDPDLLSDAAVYWAKIAERGHALDEIGRALSFAHGNADVSFRASLVYELTGSRERALAALADALRGGYSLQEIETEPALANLRQDHRYQQLVRAKLNSTEKGKG
jgi:eukaryotic-like serine/threonine-protein kinase